MTPSDPVLKSVLFKSTEYQRWKIRGTVPSPRRRAVLFLAKVSATVSRKSVTKL